MARPQKCGMDYFPHDTDALTDEKIEALRMLYGNDGYAFYFIMLERIYRTEHFELDISDTETRQILSKKMNITDELFDKILNTALKRNCFDAEYHGEFGILTSQGIKKRANVVIEKRVKSKKTYENRVSVAETTQETPTETHQKVHKGEERKGEERKGEKRRENKKLKTFLSDSYEYRLSKLLLDKILLNNPENKQPDMQVWARQIDLMLRVDKREPNEIAKIIDYCQKDSFWKSNILSTKKLRDKYDQLVIRSKEPSRKEKPVRSEEIKEQLRGEAVAQFLRGGKNE